MAWENNCRIIVMTTNLRERGRIKCDQYWPDEGQQEFGDFTVALTDTADLSSHVVRTFKVWQTKVADEEEGPNEECFNGECRVIYQYHFTVWPDHGVPEQAFPLLSFIRKIRMELKEDDGPLLVHCSAGVGRTGTFIALDIGLQQIQFNGTIDIRSLVAKMRTERNLMVQTEAQYIFIYDALKEAIEFGVTEVAGSELLEYVENLQQVDEASGKSGFAKEYEKLSLDPSPPLQYCAGKRDVNAAKNRSSDIVPIEKTRVVVRKSPGIDGTDYINASFVNDYRAPNAYIATQAPLAVTMEDFWRMIWEQGSSTIVMLSSLEEDGQLRYWPSKKNATFSNYRVELLSCQEYGTYSRRDFNLSSTGYDYTRTVRHFQLQVWPPDTIPDADVGVALLDLLNQVETWQAMAAEGPVVVHCDYGVGRTGVFCALSILTKRLKLEGCVDVFQTVRSLRSQRPYMIESQKQYTFIYKTLAGFIESCDTYSNFKRLVSSPSEE
jgi:netrin-G3 ligand